MARTFVDNEKEAEDEATASAHVQEILGTTKPKHLGEGLTRGIGYIVRGAIGGIGCAVLMPAVGAAEGHKEAGVIGSIIGGVSGVVVGVVQGVNVVGGGIVTGLGQMVLGAVATPRAVIAPSQGKWWNAREGEWVSTNLLDEERWIKSQGVSQHDEDILGEDVLSEVDNFNDGDDDNDNINNPGTTNNKKNTKKVKETGLYDLLGLDPGVDTQMIKRRYYLIARKYAPDRVGANHKAQKKFQEIGRAYMILSNEDFRAKYDRVGYERLWEDEEDESQQSKPEVDPRLLYTLLYGSEKFLDYIGRLAAATEARVGDQHHSRNVSLEQARLLQKRRVTRLALALAERLSKWAEDDLQLAAKADWMAEADTLTDASYGVELVHVIGKVYSVSAVQFLGSVESGIGMPSIHQWARKQVQFIQSKTRGVKATNIALGGVDRGNDHRTTTHNDVERRHLHQTVGTALDKSEGDAKAEEVAMEILKKSSLQSSALNLLWKQTVVDITTTLHEVVQMVLHDQNVSKEVRKKRAEGLSCLGEIFACTKGKEEPIPEQSGLEEIAFHALLDTVWREELQHRAQVHEESPERK